MLTSEKVAIAAHLHVLLRRKTGRVTDIEWMTTNLEYAAEIVRVARNAAALDGVPELAEWATKLEQALQPATPAPRGVGTATASRAAPSLGTVAVANLARSLVDATVSATVQAFTPAAPQRNAAQAAFRASAYQESAFQESTFGYAESERSRLRRDPDAPRYVGGLR
jgi:hypothetical protein